MYGLQGHCRAVPQRTHIWNNKKFRAEINERLWSESAFRVVERGDGKAKPRWFGIVPVFHILVLGGWRRVCVLEPAENIATSWRVGWLLEDGRLGVSLVPIDRRVRVLIGPTDTTFFGFTPSGAHIPLHSYGQYDIADTEGLEHVQLL
jgi:hypothetical protein